MAMVRHIVGLKLKEEFSRAEKKKHAEKIKQELENLKNIIPGIIEFTVITEVLPTSTVEVVFTSIFESEEALAAYQTHPAHVRAAEFVRSVRSERVCIDYENDSHLS
ncbi:MAG: Dabb family protein [Planctomycetes bacterium]|nr:Dabb family protein [Planctomycetota bacterium]